MSDTNSVVKDDDYWIQKNIEYRAKRLENSKRKNNNILITTSVAGSNDMNIKIDNEYCKKIFDEVRGR